jgi:hypothetical protein
MKKWIFQEHLLKCSFILDRESTQGFVVAVLVNNGVDDVEEHFFVDLDRFRTNRTSQTAYDLEHGITSMMNISIKIKKALPHGRVTTQ